LQVYIAFVTYVVLHKMVHNQGLCSPLKPRILNFYRV
jgi:hypothetical protein